MNVLFFIGNKGNIKMPMEKYKGAKNSAVKEYAIMPGEVEVKFASGDINKFKDKTHGPDWMDKLKQYLVNGKFASRHISGTMTKEDKKEANESEKTEAESSYNEWKERRKSKSC